jgi:ATP phosphoribosyltransferase regulatory subunit
LFEAARVEPQSSHSVSSKNPPTATSESVGGFFFSSAEIYPGQVMTEPLSRVPQGTRYHFGAEARLRRRVEDAAMSVFAGWSYEELTTPSLDYYTLFERGMGRDEARRAFRFADADGRLLALRPDVTSAAARAAATLLAARPRPLRLCYAANVFRAQGLSRAQARRESTQLGCECVGAAGTAADAEVLAVAVEVLERIGLAGRFRVTLNSVGFFNGAAERLTLDAGERAALRQLVSVRDAAQLETFLAARGAGAAEAARFARLVQLPGGRELIGAARGVFANARTFAALDALEDLWRVAERAELSDNFEIDLGDAAGLDYYTGLTFKIYVEGAGARVGGGGRYDDLAANFGRAEPAVGFVLDLDALTETLLRAGELPQAAGREAARLGGGDPAAILVEARRRRAAGERVRIGAGACDERSL